MNAAQGNSGHGQASVSILAVMMMLVPALGVPVESFLQDSFKSMLAALGVLLAALAFVWPHNAPRAPLRWHRVWALPLMLMLYALGSTLWSHPYLGAVEAVRWFLFSLLLWLGSQTFTLPRMTELAWAVHLGAVFAAGWAALQFWFDLSLFPQAAHPASTFVNRNFFAEYAVVCLPFSVWLLAQARHAKEACFLAVSAGFLVVALMMTGTRSALLAMGLLIPAFAVLGFKLRRQLACGQWSQRQWGAVLALGLATVLGLGLLPTGDPKVTAEMQGQTALARGFSRSASMVQAAGSPASGSWSVRLDLWKATAQMVAAHPLRGVGAGAWEVHLPLYQSAGQEIETDYQAHNEALQLVAEDGVIGWAFLLALAAYLLRASWLTLKPQSAAAQAEAPLRAMALCSLLALAVVSLVGFPWRLAGTGLLFALNLAILAASDLRLANAQAPSAVPQQPWRTAHARWASCVVAVLLGLAAYMSWQAFQAERHLVQAARLALAISRGGQPNSPAWQSSRQEMLTHLKAGVAINPHYRKLTAVVGEELARWGDWADAVVVWKSVARSRPYVVGLLTNIGQGELELGDVQEARRYLLRAQQVQPTAKSVRWLNLQVLQREGQTAVALALAREELAKSDVDFRLLEAIWRLGVESRDFDLAIAAMQLRNQRWPERAAMGWLKLASLYAEVLKDDGKALAAYRAALAAAPAAEQAGLRARIPPTFAARL